MLGDRLRRIFRAHDRAQLRHDAQRMRRAHHDPHLVVGSCRRRSRGSRWRALPRAAATRCARRPPRPPPCRRQLAPCRPGRSGSGAARAARAIALFTTHTGGAPSRSSSAVIARPCRIGMRIVEKKSGPTSIAAICEKLVGIVGSNPPRIHPHHARRPGERRLIGERDRAHVRLRSKALQQVVEEGALLGGGGVARRRQANPRREKPLRVESRIEPLTPTKLRTSRAEPDQQHQGQRHFAHHEHVARAAARASRGAARARRAATARGPAPRRGSPGRGRSRVPSRSRAAIVKPSTVASMPTHVRRAAAALRGRRGPRRRVRGRQRPRRARAVRSRRGAGA